MSEWKRVHGRAGYRFMKDGRFVGKDKVPAEIRISLETKEVDQSLSEETYAAPETDRSCIFCGMHSRLMRPLNGQTIYLCDEHYYSESIGKVAQRYNEITKGVTA